jgi:hypothetical protein
MSGYESVTAKVEKFRKELAEGEVKILPSAKTIIITRVHGKDFLGRDKVKNRRTFADLLGLAMSKYMLYKDDPPSQTQMDVTYDLLDCINRGRTWGVIKSTNLTNKLKDCQEQNSKLKERADKLETEVSKLRTENKELHQALDRFGGRSDVVEE